MVQLRRERIAGNPVKGAKVRWSSTAGASVQRGMAGFAMVHLLAVAGGGRGRGNGGRRVLLGVAGGAAGGAAGALAHLRSQLLPLL